MASTYVNDLRLEEIGSGEQSGTWGDTTNTNLELIAEAFSFGTEAITTNADTHTTTIADGATDPGRSMFLKYTGTLDSACTITLAPNTISKLWFIENGTSGSQNIIIKQGSGATITVPPGDTKAIYSDGAGSGAAMVDAFASLSVVDLKVQDDLTVTDDMTVGGTLGVTGVLTATSLDISGDIDVDGTTNLDVVDIDGAVQIDATLSVGVNDTGYDVKFFGDTASAYMLWDASADDLILGGAAGLSVNSAALVTGVLTTTAATVSNGGGQFNGGIVVGVDDTGYDVKMFGATSGKYMEWDASEDILFFRDNTAIRMGNGSDVNLFSDGANFVIDATGYILFDADGGDIKFLDAGTEFGRIYKHTAAFNMALYTLQQDADILFQGNDGGSTITALTLDMSDAGTAIFNHDIKLNDAGRLFLGSDNDAQIYNTGSHTYIQNYTTDQDIIFNGIDGGSSITALTLDMSAAGRATFNHAVVSNAGAGQTAFHATVGGAYIQVDGSSSTAMAFGMTGGNASPATAASTSLGFHHWNNSSWVNPVGITRDGITFNGDTAAANALNDYEEGTWSPTLIGLTFASVTSANYTKIGNRVLFDCQVLMPSTSATQDMQILTLPFSTSSSDSGGSLGYTTSASSKLGGAIGLLTQGANVSFYVDGGPTAFTQADFSGAQIRISGQYQTNS